MIEYFLSLLIVLTLYLLYTCWVKPMRTIRGYVRHLEKRGYKVLQSTYNPFKFDMFAQIRKGVEQGDALKIYKEERSRYDVIIGNALNTPRI